MIDQLHSLNSREFLKSHKLDMEQVRHIIVYQTTRIFTYSPFQESEASHKISYLSAPRRRLLSIMQLEDKLLVGNSEYKTK